MKKLSAFLNTPLGIVIVVGALALAVEVLFMELLHKVFIVRLELSGTAWGIIDAATLTAFLAPALYFLVFRRIKASEERLRQIAATAQDAIIVIDEHARITEWNSAAQRLFQHSTEEALGQRLHHLITPPRYHADAERGFAHFANSGEGPVVGKTIEIIGLRKDGSEFPIELSVSATRLNHHWHAVGIVRDITERKQGEEAFRLMIASLTQNIGAEFFHETVRGLCAWLGTECAIIGEVMDGNRVRALAMQLDGKAVEQYEYALPGTPCNDLARKGYCAYYEGVCRLFPEDKDLADMGAESYVGTPVRNRKGESIGILCAISRRKLALPAKTREVMEMIATRVGMEIERRRSEDMLRESEKRFYQLFENMSSGVAVYQPDAACEVFTFKSINSALERIERVKREEVLGSSVEEVFPSVRAFGLLEVLQRVCRSGEAEHIPPAFYQDERISGWRENYVYRLNSGEVVAVYDDVTERKQADELLAAKLVEIQQARLEWQAVFDSIDDPIFLHDDEFRVSRANTAYARAAGMDIRDVIGQPYWKVFPRGEGPMASCLESRRSHIEASEEFSTDGENYLSRAFMAENLLGVQYAVHILENITERKQAVQERLEAGTRIKNALEDAIGAIAATLEQRDPYTAGHQRRVAQLAAAIGEEMGLAREMIEGIHFGGLIHDLGKISVPAEILGKPGRISDIEFGLIKTHAEAGYQIVKGIAFPWPVADMVRQHHERLDGSGYPQGLAGEQITLEARILAVADVVEAMSANRPYRPGLGMDAALEEITQARGAQLDPVAVDACLRLIREKGFVFSK